MRTLDRYIAAIFLKNFAIAALALTGLFVFQTFLGELIDAEYPFKQLMVYHAMNIPAIFVMLSAPAVLFATVFTISGLTRTNELTACYSIGVGIDRIGSILLSLVFMISCLSLVLQDRILPPLYRNRTSFYWREMKKRLDFYMDVKQDKIWYRSKNLIYNLRSFNAKSKTINGMAVYRFDDDFNLLQVIDAEQAQYSEKGWSLTKGVTTEFIQGDQFPKTRTFKSQELIIPETPKDFQEIEKEVEGLRIKELHSYIGKAKFSGSDTKAFEVKFHSRFSLSFIPIVMCLLGIPFSTRGRRDGSAAKDLGTCLGVTFFYWLFYSVGLSLGTNGTLPPMLAAWLPSSIFVVMATVFLVKSK